MIDKQVVADNHSTLVIRSFSQSHPVTCGFKLKMFTFDHLFYLFSLFTWNCV